MIEFGQNNVSLQSGTLNNYKIRVVSMENMNASINYIKQVVDEYEDYMGQINRNKLYHFIFNGSNKDGKYTYTTSLLSDLSNEKYKNYQT